MYRLIVITVSFLLFINVNAENSMLLERLDSTLTAMPEDMQKKQQRIDFLAKSLANKPETSVALQICEDLYQEYHAYQYNPALSILDKGLDLAHSSGNKYYAQLFAIHKVALLSDAGLYLEAEKQVAMIDSSKLERRLRFEYYIARFNLYRSIADYCNDKNFSPEYRSMSYNDLKNAMKYLPNDPSIRNYYLGDWATFIKQDAALARKYYKEAVKYSKESTRIHAMSCYVLARNYLKSYGQKGAKLYEEYMIKAAISDAKSLTMENLALQRLAIFFFQNGQGDLDKAQKYIIQALDDAKFYNSRLRILEISQILPAIINHYQEAISKRNHNLQLTIIAVSVLSGVLMIVLGLFYKLNKNLIYSRKQEKEVAMQLKKSFERQKEMNSQLTILNDKLKGTNRKREELTKLFIDLCDKFISKLSKYQTLVTRKIKSGQVQQLLALSNSSRLSEEDADVFYHKFDKAFLAFYPTFVEEFNGLLRDDAKIYPKIEGTLTNDMRVFALIRLGVKESYEISNLLFYSPRTIYNYRSQMKTRAINRDTFENDVRGLCTVM